MAGKFWSPLHLSAAVPNLSGVGQSVTVNPQKLLNPNRGPMLVDQFRVTGTLLDPSIVSLELHLGSIPLMSGPVTLGGLMPRYLRGNANGAQNSLDYIFVWHLPKPMLVPPNVQLTARLATEGMGPAWGASYERIPAVSNLRFSVVGRSLGEDAVIPDEIAVPWVAETTTRLNPYDNFVSGDGDLINHHNVPLYVQQFVSVRNALGIAGDATAYVNDVYVQMTGSNGIAVIRDPAPYGLLFPEDRGILEASCVLQPGQFIRAGITSGPQSGTISSPITGTPINLGFISIGMVGYRMVPTPHSN